MIYKGMSYKGTGEEGTRVQDVWDDGTYNKGVTKQQGLFVIDQKVKPQQMSAQQQSAPQQLHHM